MNLLKSTSHVCIGALAMFAISSSLRAAQSERHEHKELSTQNSHTLTLRAVVGAIEIKTHDQNLVIFDSVLKPGSSGKANRLIDDIEFEYQGENGDVTINVKWKDNVRPNNANLSAKHTIIVPAKYNIDVKTAGGSIIGKDIDGRVIAGTAGGEIKFAKVNGKVNAHTSGGDIIVEEIHGDAEINTSGGSIKMGKVEGDVVARTSGGNIKVRSVTGNLNCNTSGGSISAEMASQIDKPLELSTAGGDISLALPADFKADLKASTSGGRVDCALPLEGKVKPSSISGKVNGGGPSVLLRTSGGNIEVAKR
jgi:hypothetical protein